MSVDFYPFVDSGDPAPDNRHINGRAEAPATEGPLDSNGVANNTGATSGAEIPTGMAGVAGSTGQQASGAAQTSVPPQPGATPLPTAPLPTYTTRISVYDDMLSTPRVVVVEQHEIRAYLEDITNTVYRIMKEQGGHLSLMVIRELVENFIHAHFVEPVISVLDGGDTIRFADQGPGIADKERAFEFGVTSADRNQKRYIRGTGSGLPMVQEYLENAGGAISIEDNLGSGTVITVSVDPNRVAEISGTAARGAAVRPEQEWAHQPNRYDPYGMYAGSAGAMGATGMNGNQPAAAGYTGNMPHGYPQPGVPGMPGSHGTLPQQNPYGMPVGYPGTNMGGTAAGTPMGYPVPNPYQQFGGQFSTIPQYTGQAASYYGQQPGMPPMASPTGPDISERGMLALQYLAEHNTCGPTDLASAFGESVPTWSRELANLTTSGLIRKHGQKRVLTDMGLAWLQQQQL